MPPPGTLLADAISFEHNMNQRAGAQPVSECLYHNAKGDLCAAWVSDVLKMNWNQIIDKGIFIQQGKTGIEQIKTWTERLNAAVDICREWGQDGLIIRTMYGARYSYNGVQ